MRRGIWRKERKTEGEMEGIVHVSHTTDMTARRISKEERPWLLRTVPAQQLQLLRVPLEEQNLALPREERGPRFQREEHQI
jgi:hypothetical protein